MNENAVMEAFEKCFCGENDHCPGCYQDGPGFGFACRKALCADVLEILKNHVPRVLTWDEMVEAGKAHRAVYVEEHENAYTRQFWGLAVEGIEPPERGYNYPGGTAFNVVDTDDNMWDGDLYGLDSTLGWRAWTAVPSAEQMKGTPWK